MPYALIHVSPAPVDGIRLGEGGAVMRGLRRALGLPIRVAVIAAATLAAALISVGPAQAADPGAPSIAAAFGSASILLNGTTTLTFTLTNPIGTNQTGVAFSDSLPIGLVVSSPNELTNSCGGTATATAGGTSISLTGGSIAGFSNCTLLVNVTGTAAGSYTDTSGAVSSTNVGTGNTASASLTVVAPPSISASFSPTSIPVNGTSTLTFEVSNPPVNTAGLSGLAFSDTLPAGLVVANPNDLGNFCSMTATATPGGNSISLTGGSAVPGETCVVVVNVTGTSAGSYTDSSGAVSSANGGTGNTATASLTVVGPPSIAAAFSPTSITVNGTSTLTFTLTNPNTVAASGVAFTDSLPAGLVVATPNGLTNSCGGTVTATAGSGTISLTGGTIAANSTCKVVVTVTGTTASTDTNTSGPVSSANGGTGSTSNSATLTVLTATSTALSSSPDPSLYGQTVTYTATVTPNPGGGSVEFKDGGTAIPGCAAVALSSSGTASCQVTYTTLGSHTITAVYSGHDLFAASTSGPVTQVVEETPAGLCQLTDSYVQSSPRYLALPSWQRAAIREVLAVLCDRLTALNPRLPARALGLLLAPYKFEVTALARGGFLTPTQASTLIYLADNLTLTQPPRHHHRFGTPPRFPV